METETVGLKRQILDTARHVLTSEGYGSLSMRRIARQIGYSATSIYLHFENKDQLVHALIDEGVDILHERLTASIVGKHGPQQRLSALCLAYLEFGRELPEYYEIMYILHPEYMERYPADKYRRWRRNLELMAEPIRTGAKEGIFIQIDPMLAVNTIWAQLHGVVTLLASERVDKRIDSDNLKENARRSVLNSLQPHRQSAG